MITEFVRHRRNIETCLLACLILLLITSTMNGLSFEVVVGTRKATIRPDQITLVLLLPLCAAALLTRRLRWHRTRLDLPIVGLLLANLFSSLLFSPVRGGSLQGVALIAIYASMYFVTANLLLHHPNWSPALSRLFAGFGIAHAVYGLLAFLAYSQGWDIGGVATGRVLAEVKCVRSTFIEPNLLGIYLSVIVVFLGAFNLLEGKGRNRWLAAGGLVPVGLTLVLTLTRSAWLAVVGVLPLLLALALVQTRNLLRVAARVLPLLAALVLIVSISWLALDPLLSELAGTEGVLSSRIVALLEIGGSAGQGETDTDTTQTGDERFKERIRTAREHAAEVQELDEVTVGSLASTVVRLEAYRWGVEEWLKAPIFGHGTLAGGAIGRQWWLSSVVQSLYDTGIVGTAFLLWMYGVAIVCPWLAYRRAATPRNRTYLLAYALANAVLFLTSQFTSFLWVGFPWVFMGLTMGQVHASDVSAVERTTA
jgi:hypothetical protein